MQLNNFNADLVIKGASLCSIYIFYDNMIFCSRVPKRNEKGEWGNKGCVKKKGQFVTRRREVTFRESISRLGV